jgi:phospholipase/carboxylesterase
MVSVASAACRARPWKEDGTMSWDGQVATEGRIAARPGQPRSPAEERGLQPLGLAKGRDGLLYVPKSYREDRPAPLAVMLHGAGGTARGGLAPFQPLADKAGLLLFAPDSRGQTWDVIHGGFGTDVAYIDQALSRIFERYAVNPARIAAGGFSDGASYALSIGLTNGGLFTHVIAFSPGFMAPAGRQGRPRIYVSHGTRDQILPIDVCSRRLVPQLQHGGYDVLYREFDGPHTVPEKIAREALDWFLGAQ